jgi:hypothetical protein
MFLICLLNLICLFLLSIIYYSGLLLRRFNFLGKFHSKKYFIWSICLLLRLFQWLSILFLNLLFFFFNNRFLFFFNNSFLFFFNNSFFIFFNYRFLFFFNNSFFFFFNNRFLFFLNNRFLFFFTNRFLFYFDHFSLIEIFFYLYIL